MSSAIIAAWDLGLRLRAHRDQLGLSLGTAAKRTHMQASNLSSVEAGRKRITAGNLGILAKLYAIEPAELKVLNGLRVRAEQADWYHQYSWMFDEVYLRYFGLEHGADHLQVYQSSLIPGPLQTPEYAEAIIRSASPYIRLTEVEPRVEVRQTRRKRLFAQVPLRITVLLGEGALRQKIGERDVMCAQLHDLAELAAQPHVQIRVLPFSAGAHPSLGGPFHLLSFEGLPDVVWQETITGRWILDDRQQVREYALALAESTLQALSAADSLDLIQEVAKEMT